MTVSSGFAHICSFCFLTKILQQREWEVNRGRAPGRTTVQVPLVRQMCSLSDPLPYRTQERYLEKLKVHTLIHKPVFGLC